MRFSFSSDWPVLMMALLVGAGSLSAQQPARAPFGIPSDLRGAEEQHAAALAAITARSDERLYGAKVTYAAALSQVQQEATGRGDLDSALAAKAEREGLAAAGAAAPAKALPKAILPHRRRFDEAVAQAQQVSNREAAAQTKGYLVTLEALQTRITKQGDLEAALEVKQRREALATQLAVLESGQGTAMLPALETVSPSTPAPSAIAPATSLALAPIAVATELKAKAGAIDPAPGTIVFDGPPGDGRRGAKGILLKADTLKPLIERAGSTWAFRYTRSGSARNVQIIHPAGAGQAIINLGADYVGLSVPKAWIEAGYSGGDAKRTRLTPGSKKILPLQDGVDYVVVSRLSPAGSYELFINGELVATGRASSAPPLDLTIPEGSAFPGSGSGKLEFKGADGAALPLKWLPGWSGVLVGPLDNGLNSVRDVRFYPGVADVGGAKR